MQLLNILKKTFQVVYCIYSIYSTVYTIRCMLNNMLILQHYFAFRPHSYILTV